MCFLLLFYRSWVQGWKFFCFWMSIKISECFFQQHIHCTVWFCSPSRSLHPVFHIETFFWNVFNVGPGTGYYSIHGDRNGEGIFETLWAGICCSDSILFLCSFGLVDFDVGKIIVIYKFWFSGSNHIKFWFILALGVLPILDSNAWLIGLGCLAICEGNNGSGPRKLLPLYCLNGKWHVCRRKAL
jgi:hypothetical protein